LTDFEGLAEKLSMTELMRLQDALSRAIVRRFEKHLALTFSDIVDSTAYFAAFGDEAGRKLQQRHYDLVAAAIVPEGGRVIDTAGDGVFLCFDQVTAAVRAMVTLKRAILSDNDARNAAHRLHVRIGVHAGPVLSDGTLVSGEVVNFCNRVASSADREELRLTPAAHAELGDATLRRRCQPVRGVQLKGVAAPQDLFSLAWLDPARFPSLVGFEDGSVQRLPARDVIRFGRLREENGAAANDIVITLEDPELLIRVSRWHFELHRKADGYMLRSITASGTTALNGRTLVPGEMVPLRPGAKVCLSGAVTLTFVSEDFSQETTHLPG